MHRIMRIDIGDPVIGQQCADDPVDIRSVGPRYQPTNRYRGIGLVNRVFQAVREYF